MSKIESCVIQEHKKGCGVACVATILGVKYLSISNYFDIDLNESGISATQITEFLAGFGFDIISNSAIYYGNGYKKISECILKPFADIHIVAGYQTIDATNIKNETSSGHWMIMDEDGTIFCPSNGKELVGSWLVFDMNIGIFYPRYWKYEEEKKDALNNYSYSINSSDF